MRIDVRQWAIGLSAAGCVSAAAAYLQPWLTHWMVVFTWNSPFCGSANDGEVLPVNYTWTVWWTSTAIIGGAVAGRVAARGRSGRTVDARLRLGMVAAAAVGSLTVVAALHGLVGVSASAGPALRGIPSCLELADFVPLVAWGIVLGAVCATAALRVPEIAIGLGCGWLLVWAGSVLIGISASMQLHTSAHSVPFASAGGLQFWVSRSMAQDLSIAIALVAIPLAGLLSFWITRNVPRALLAAMSVHLLPFVCYVIGGYSYWH